MPSRFSSSIVSCTAMNFQSKIWKRPARIAKETVLSEHRRERQIWAPKDEMRGNPELLGTGNRKWNFRITCGSIERRMLKWKIEKSEQERRRQDYTGSIVSIVEKERCHKEWNSTVSKEWWKEWDHDQTGARTQSRDKRCGDIRRLSFAERTLMMEVEHGRGSTIADDRSYTPAFILDR